MRTWGITAALLLTLAGTTISRAAKPTTNERDTAEQALMQGQIDTAVAGLRGFLNANPKDARAHLMLCRAYYAEDQADAAVSECEAAMDGLSGSAEAQDWMGRACGQKAQSAGAIAGYRLARRVQAAFEKAVQLDMNNGDAVDDLGEYYIGAPVIIGGGLDKADALAERELALVPQAAHRTHALAAEANKDYPRAEHEFRAAVMVAGRPEAWADLGHFYARRKQYDQATDALRKCLAADSAMGAAVVDAASILIEMDREPQLAGNMLRGYLAGNAKSDAAPAFKVHEMLGDLLLKMGDKPGAKIEFETSLSLAHEYAPAKKALQSF